MSTPCTRNLVTKGTKCDVGGPIDSLYENTLCRCSLSIYTERTKVGRWNCFSEEFDIQTYQPTFVDIDCVGDDRLCLVGTLENIFEPGTFIVISLKDKEYNCTKIRDIKCQGEWICIIKDGI